jgi:hypothetical protein
MTQQLPAQTSKPRKRRLLGAATNVGEARGVCCRHAFVTGPVPWLVSSHALAMKVMSSLRTLVKSVLLPMIKTAAPLKDSTVDAIVDFC